MEYHWEEPSKSKKSTIWSHFHEERKHEKAKCKHCQKIVDCKGGSTKGKVIHPKYYKHLKKGVHQNHLGRQKMGWFLAD